MQEIRRTEGAEGKDSLVESTQSTPRKETSNYTDKKDVKTRE